MIPSQLVFIGFGSVAKALLTILQLKEPELAQLPLVIVDQNKSTIYNSEIYNKVKQRGIPIQVVILKLGMDNYTSFFQKYVLPHSIVIELAYRLDTARFIVACQERESIFINTALDIFWDDGQSSDKSLATLKDDTQHHILKSPRTNQQQKRHSSLVNHGMNPGLVSHFVKYTLYKICHEVIQTNDPRKEQLLVYLREGKYNLIAKTLGLTLIQIPERDTQYSLEVRTTEELFVNTWSVVGLLDEAYDSLQLSWGSHETRRPREYEVDQKNRQLIVPIWSCQVKTQSYEPEGGEFTGFCIPHAESYSLANFLKTDDYSPSVYYSYLCPDDAKILLQYEFVLSDDTDLPQEMYILRSDDIEEGYDSVGTLCYFRNLDHPQSNSKNNLRTFWCGTTVHNEFALKISPEVNATTVQVGISLCAAIHFLIKNSTTSLIEAEQVDSLFVIDYCKEYLDDFSCKEISREEYNPTSDTFYDLSVLPEMFFSK